MDVEDAGEADALVPPKLKAASANLTPLLRDTKTYLPSYKIYIYIPID